MSLFCLRRPMNSEVFTKYWFIILNVFTISFISDCFIAFVIISPSVALSRTIADIKIETCSFTFCATHHTLKKKSNFLRIYLRNNLFHWTSTAFWNATKKSMPYFVQAIRQLTEIGSNDSQRVDFTDTSYTRKHITFVAVFTRHLGPLVYFR